MYKNKKEVKHERRLVLLLGGSIYDDGANIRITNRRRRGDEHLLKKQDVQLEQLLWQRDFRVISEFFERTNATIWRCIPSSLHSNRNESYELIQQFFHLDNEFVKGEQKNFIIYWCGHGLPESGDWGFSVGGEITCRNVINAWRSRPMADQHNDTSSLTIISDTCYSGGWIDELRAENIPRLAYQAASRADEPAYAVNDGNIPRSLLMRKFIIEYTHSIPWYTWTCSDQHPEYICDYGEIEYGEDFSEGQQRTLVRSGPFYFFAVNRHWSTNGKLITKAQKTQLNKLAEYGTYIDDH